jgi:hypothetical protein
MSIMFQGGPLDGQTGGEPLPEEAPEKPSGPDALRAALEMVSAYQETEQDDIDLADAEKIRTMIQSLLAKQQKEQEAAMGTTPALRGMKRAMSAGG